MRRQDMDKVRQALIKNMEDSGEFSEQELKLVRKSGFTLFGYERAALMRLTGDELADILEIVAKMLRMKSPFLASAARWAAADVYDRALRK